MYIIEKKEKEEVSFPQTTPTTTFFICISMHSFRSSKQQQKRNEVENLIKFLQKNAFSMKKEFKK